MGARCGECTRLSRLVELTQADRLGTCFGFSVRSRLRFHYLRDGLGQPLEITTVSDERTAPAAELVWEWVVNRDRLFEARLYRNGHRFRLSVSGEGWYDVDPTVPSVGVPESGNPVKREERLWGIPALLCYLARRDTPIHAAAVEVEGEAILLAAPGTFGKTTLAAAFGAAGRRVLSEDLACVRLASTPTVVPGPAMLRIRRDVADALGAHLGTVLDAGDERVHVALDDRLRGDSQPVPLRAVVFLRSSDDGIRLEPADMVDAIRDLRALSFFLPDLADQARCFEAVADLARRVPLWNLYRPLRVDALEAVVERLLADG